MKKFWAVLKLLCKKYKNNEASGDFDLCFDLANYELARSNEAAPVNHVGIKNNEYLSLLRDRKALRELRKKLGQGVKHERKSG